MNKLNRKELRIKIENLYLTSLGVSDSNYIVVLDAIKSIIGMDLENINTNVLNSFVQDLKTHNVSKCSLKEYEEVPEVVSMYNLEKSLLNRNYNRSIENVYYLSRVSDGLQILEFLLEFSLKYCNNSYRCIWHIIRMQKFLNNKYMIESLNKSISLILAEDFIDPFEAVSNKVIWSDFLSLEFEKVDELLLYYTIYKSDLIRHDVLKKLIVSRLLFYFNNINTRKKNSVRVQEEQLKIGRHWILDYVNNMNEKAINFDMLILFDNVRSCLMLSDDKVEIQYLWSYLNKRLCN